MFGRQNRKTVSKNSDDLRNAKKLVVYYSWGGNTKAVAEYIADQTGSDLLELIPSEAYPIDYDACVDEVNRRGRSFEPELSSLRAERSRRFSIA